MRSVRQRDTAPELAVRRFLHAHGLRFRLHRKDLPGRPDIVLPRFRTVIFVHGCFWHRHGCRYTTTPKTNPEFWQGKFRRNKERDLDSEAALRSEGWRPLVIWSCEVGVAARMQALLRAIRKSSRTARGSALS